MKGRMGRGPAASLGASLVALSSVLGAACGPSSSACEGSSGCVQAEGNDAGPLVGCIVGAWRPLGSGGNCAPIPCSSGAALPECAQADCTKLGYTLFVPSAPEAASGTMFSGSFVMSESSGTWSAAIPPERFAYVARGSVLETDGGSGSRSQEMTCTQEQLVFGQLAVHTRLSPSEADALRALVIADGGTWTGAPRP